MFIYQIPQVQRRELRGSPFERVLSLAFCQIKPHSFLFHKDLCLLESQNGPGLYKTGL